MKESEPAAPQQHLNAIRDLVIRVLYPAELYERFLAHLAAALNASSAAVWRWDPSGECLLCAVHDVCEDSPAFAWAPYRELIAATLRGDAPGRRLLSPDDAENPSEVWLLVHRVHPRCPLAIAVAHGAAASPADVHRRQRLVESMAELLAESRCIPWEGPAPPAP